MKRFLATILLAVTLGFLVPHPSRAATTKAPIVSLTTITGRIVLEKESYNRVWYIFPKTNERYYARDGKRLQELAILLAARVDSKTFKQIPVAAETKKASTTKWRGWFITPDGKTYWYVSATDGRRYPIDTPTDGQALIAQLGFKIDDATLVKAAMNKTQVTFDPTYRKPTYVVVQNGAVTTGQGQSTIRPIASLTKLMTALVLAESPLDWNTLVSVSASAIRYPRDLVGSDATSEVDLRVGDRIAVNDLWISMLVASSNQSAVALSEATGWSRDQFVNAMNEKAKALGLKHTRFLDIAGLDADTISTAEEMAKVADAAFANPKIANATQILNHNFTALAADGSSRIVNVTDRNFSLRAFGPTAMKTGYLVEAQRTVAMQKNGRTIVVLNAQSMPQRNEIIKKLLE